MANTPKASHQRVFFVEGGAAARAGECLRCPRGGRSGTGSSDAAQMRQTDTPPRFSAPQA
ncbi:MAG: hypothetical protein R3E99_12580 [Burkholderiaceae bacterium]